MSSSPLQQFLSAFRQALQEERFVKLSLGGYHGDDARLKTIHVRRITVKKEGKLSFTYHYQTQDIVKNHSLPESLALVETNLETAFRSATLCTLDFDLQLSRTDTKPFTLHRHKPTHSDPISSEHNRHKHRLIEAAPDKAYLHALNVTNAVGDVLPGAQDKYRQINKYVEILSTLIKPLLPNALHKIVDMGSGKGYLTFALYDYLNHTLKLDSHVIGVETRPELVKLCNDIAKQSNFEHLQFVQGTIADYDSRDTNILIALHACDTATDDAICKGIEAGAELIVVAPCCHKQIRRDIERHKARNDLDFLTRHGIFMERQAEMVTDGLRALILEYFGYRTKVFEFISDAHTPKNVMIVGTKNTAMPVKSAAILQKITDAKKFFGIEEHYLERCLGMTLYLDKDCF